MVCYTMIYHVIKCYSLNNILCHAILCYAILCYTQYGKVDIIETNDRHVKAFHFDAQVTQFVHNCNLKQCQNQEPAENQVFYPS